MLHSLFQSPERRTITPLPNHFLRPTSKEDFRRTWYQTEDEFKEAVDKYIDYYNDYRPHQRLGFMTPNQVESEYFKSNNT